MGAAQSTAFCQFLCDFGFGLDYELYLISNVWLILVSPFQGGRSHNYVSDFRRLINSSNSNSNANANKHLD